MAQYEPVLTAACRITGRRRVRDESATDSVALREQGIAAERRVTARWHRAMR